MEDKKQNIYYVYLHRRKDDNEVFYVGKGKNYRASTSSNRNQWWQRIVSKHGYVVEYVEKNLSEQSAYDLEVETIKFYRDNNHNLCNLSDGGEGNTGAVRKQAITDGLMMDLNIKIPTIVSNRTRHFDYRHSTVLSVIISNLLSTTKVYYSRGKLVTSGRKVNKRGISDYHIVKAVDYLVENNYATTVNTKVTDSVKRYSALFPTQLLFETLKLPLLQ